MELRDYMFEQVRLWNSSDDKMFSFVEDKEYSLAKFKYWIVKYNKATTDSSLQQFTEIPIQNEFASRAVQGEKLIELEIPTGIKITIFK
jgi:hypothetical protein